MLINSGNFREALNDAVKCYRLAYGDSGFQKYFNENFDLYDEAPGSKDDCDRYLNDRLEKAGVGLSKDYFNEIGLLEDRKLVNSRGIHSGIHARKVALYAETCLNIYRKYKKYFPQKIQREIEEFDNLENFQIMQILAVMHDVARTRSGADHDEYRNGFYAAMLLEKYGYNRDRAVNLGVQLANKDGDYGDHSLMSKLVGSGDCLAITRLYSIEDGRFDFKSLLVWQDVIYQIGDEEVREAAKKDVREAAQIICGLERMRFDKENKRLTEIEETLEFDKDPEKLFEEYLESHEKGKQLKEFDRRIKQETAEKRRYNDNFEEILKLLAENYATLDVSRDKNDWCHFFVNIGGENVEFAMNENEHRIGHFDSDKFQELQGAQDLGTICDEMRKTLERPPSPVNIEFVEVISLQQKMRAYDTLNMGLELDKKEYNEQQISDLKLGFEQEKREVNEKIPDEEFFKPKKYSGIGAKAKTCYVEDANCEFGGKWVFEIKEVCEGGPAARMRLEPGKVIEFDAKRDALKEIIQSIRNGKQSSIFERDEKSDKIQLFDFQKASLSQEMMH